MKTCMLAGRDDEHDVGDNEDTSSDTAEGREQGREGWRGKLFDR